AAAAGRLERAIPGLRPERRRTDRSRGVPGVDGGRLLPPRSGGEGGPHDRRRPRRHDARVVQGPQPERRWQAVAPGLARRIGPGVPGRIVPGLRCDGYRECRFGDDSADRDVHPAEALTALERGRKAVVRISWGAGAATASGGGGPWHDHTERGKTMRRVRTAWVAMVTT